MEVPELTERIADVECRRRKREMGLRFEYEGYRFFIETSEVQDDEEPPTFFDAWLTELGSDGESMLSGVLMTLHLDENGQPIEMVLTDGTERTGEVAMIWNLDDAPTHEVMDWSGYDGENLELLTLIARHSEFRQIVRRWMISAAGYVATHIGKAA